MNVLDIGIVIFILFGAVLGLKRGFTKELVKAVGFIVIVILAYLLKNPLSALMYEHLPFFKFGILKGVEILNIILYEFIAFIILLIIFSILLKVLLMATSLLEKLLNATILLGIPSKIAGAILGLFHHFILVFVVLVILSLPVFNVNFISESKLKTKIVSGTPILSSMVDKTNNVLKEFITLKKDYESKEISENEFKYNAINLFLKYDVINKDTLQKLFDDGKITTFDGYQELLGDGKNA